MMSFGHQMSGTAAGVVVAPLIPGPDSALAPLVFVAITTVAALIPDLDQPGSKLSRTLGPLSWVVSWILARFSRAVFYATRTDQDRPKTNGHRTFTHTLVWCVLIGLGSGLGMAGLGAPEWAWLVGLAMFVGNLAHIAGDAMTLHGVPLLWPVLRDGKRWSCVGPPMGLRFRTGGYREKNRIKDQPRWSWVNLGEAVVTSGLVLIVGLLGLLTIWAGPDPWWSAVLELIP